MKKKVFTTSVAVCLAASMAFSMSAFAEAPAAGAGTTIVDVTLGENYVATAATEDDTINSPSASSNIVAVTLSDGTVISAESGVLTLVIDGIQYDILDALEAGLEIPENAEFAETAGAVTYSEPGKFMNMGGQTAEYTYRSALKVTADGIDDSETIPSLVNAEYDAAGVKNGAIVSLGAFFNGIIVDSAPYTIDNMSIVGMGDGANDFQGSAAMVLSQGSADVTISNSTIMTAGVIRTAAAVKENGILRIDNSVIYTEETADTQAEYDALVVPMMKRTPFALGLEGVVRATNVLGAGQGIYSDSLIVSSGWGVLSTDSGQGYDSVGTYALDVSNTVAGTGIVEEAVEGTEYFATKEINGTVYGYIAGGSGYVAYADSGVWDKFDNVKFYGGNEVQIMASSTSSAYYTNSEITSGHIGVMTQQNAGGTISIKDSTVNVAETGVQIKSGAANNGYTNVVLDNTVVNFTADSKWGKTLVELVESDDAGNPGNTSFTVDDNGDLADGSTATAIVADSNATLANGEYTGNIWNNIYNKYQVLNVTLDAATVNGTISSSYGYHLNADGTRMENGTVLYGDTTGNYLVSGVTDYATIGAQYNVANAQVNNPLNLTLTNGSTWNVVLADGTCGEAEAIYLNNLTVEEGSAIVSEVPVEFHVYGEIAIAGEISENITVVEEEAIVPSCTSSEIYAYDMADPRHTATIKAVDEEGNEVVGAIKFDAYKAFATSYFTLGYNGYEPVSIEVTEGDATLTEIKEGDEYYGEYEYNIAMNEDCVITVVVKAAAAGGESGGESGGGESAGESGEGGESAGEGGEGESAEAPAGEGESAEASASSDAIGKQTEELEITVNGVTGLAQYEDVEDGTSEVRQFKVTFDGKEYYGTIDKGVWGAKDKDGEAVIAAYKEAHEADPSFMGVPGQGGSEGGESPAGESPEGESAGAPAAGDTSEAAYKAYLKEYAAAVPAIQANLDEFNAVIDGGDYTVFPADMLFVDTYFGYAAMTYDEFVAANGAYEIPNFDPNMTPDAQE